MPVFRAYFRVINRKKAQMFVYLAVFLGVTVLVSLTGGSGSGARFEETRIGVAFVNMDAGAPLSEGLRAFLQGKADVRDYEDDEPQLRDALFFRRVQAVLRVPEGFSDSLAMGGAEQVERVSIPGSAAGIYLDALVNRYLNAASLFLTYVPGLTQAAAASKAGALLELETPVEMAGQKTASELNAAVYYFNYYAYAAFGMLIMGVSTAMLTFQGVGLKRRIVCAPLRPRSLHLQLFLGNICLAVLMWGLVAAIGSLLYRDYMLSAAGALTLMNAFLFTMAVLSIAFLISGALTSRNAVPAVANVVGLGSSFLSGVFIPQALLGDAVITVAKFTPTYWYVRANNLISSLSMLSLENLKPVLLSMLAVLGFTAAALLAALAAMKRRGAGA